MDHDEEGNETGWQLARRGIHMALNNEVEEAQELLKAEVDGSGCPQAQAGFCFIAFMVSTTMQWRIVRHFTWMAYHYQRVTTLAKYENRNSIAFDVNFNPHYV